MGAIKACSTSFVTASCTGMSPLRLGVSANINYYHNDRQIEVDAVIVLISDIKISLMSVHNLFEAEHKIYT